MGSKINGELEKAYEEISSLGFDADETISLIGLGHDWKEVLGYMKEKDVDRRHYFDAAYLMHHPVAMEYYERNEIAEEDIYKINRLYQWSVPNIDDLLSQDIPLDRFNNLTHMMQMSNYVIEQLFSRLSYDPGEGDDSGRFVFDNSDLSDDDVEELEKPLELLNSDVDFTSLNERNEAIVEEYKDELGSIILDSDSQAVYEKLCQYKHLEGADEKDLQMMALNSFFNPQGVKYALQKKVPIDYAQVVAHCYLSSPDDTKYLLDRFGLKDIGNHHTAREKSLESFDEAMKLGIENSNFAVFYGHFNDEGKKKLKSYMLRFPKHLHEDVFLSMRGGMGANLGLVDFGLDSKVWGYSSRMPGIQLKDARKLVNLKDDILKKCSEYENSIRFKDIDFKETIFRDAVLEQVGRKKRVTVEDLDRIASEYVGLERYRAMLLRDDISGINQKNIVLIAQQLSLNPNDIKKVICRESVKENYSLDDMAEKLDDISEISSRQIDSSDYGLSKIVEAEFRVKPIVRETGFMGINRQEGVQIAMYPNAVVIEALKEKDKFLSEHVSDVIGYARCYIDDKIIRVEELQSDIYDKTKKIPSALRSKYHEWPKMIMLALEHFAAKAGYKEIQLTTSELQIKKWWQYQGLRGVTAYEVYTKTPSEMGYRLKKTDIVKSEDTGAGMNLHNPLSRLMSSNRQVYNVMWSKTLSRKRRTELDGLFHMNERERMGLKKCFSMKPRKKKKVKREKRFRHSYRNEVAIFD